MSKKSYWLRLTEEQKAIEIVKRREYQRAHKNKTKIWRDAWREKQGVRPCKCGCGKLVKYLWVRGHSSRQISDTDRFWARVNKEGPIPKDRPDLGSCWLWLGKSHHGYGHFTTGQGKNRKQHQAHNVAFEWEYGSIDHKLDRDHLCRVPIYVRPTHLEQVSPRVNILRGIGIAARYAKRTHCSEGHEFAGENLAISKNARVCRICKNKKARDIYHRNQLEKKALLAARSQG